VRYLIIGAGAVGGTIGAELFESGHEVVLVARGPHLAALRATGLRFITPRGTTTLPIPAVAGPEEIDLRPDDVLVLCVKGQDTAAALAAWADRPVAGGGVAADRLPLVCAQNGTENERVALRTFARVYAITVLLPATHLEPGQISAISDPVVGVLILGRYPHGTDETVEQIAADLSASRLVVPVVPDAQRWKYAKLLRNLANAVEAVCGSGFDDPDAVRLRDLLIEEGVAVLAAAGIESASDAEQEQYLAQVTWNDVPEAPHGGGSSWQSIVRGTGTIESDYLNGEIVLLSRLHDVPAPLNARLQRLALQTAAARRKPGSVTAKQILTESPFLGDWPSTT
jgi:2-dehydropantoate 2-reductase